MKTEVENYMFAVASFLKKEAEDIMSEKMIVDAMLNDDENPTSWKSFIEKMQAKVNGAKELYELEAKINLIERFIDATEKPMIALSEKLKECNF